LSVGLLSLCLAAMVGIQIVWALAFLGWPVEVMYGESVIFDHASRLVRGEALYQPLGEPAYTLASYTPLFYVISALGQVLTGPNLLFARIVSVLAGLVGATLLGTIAAQRGRGWGAGVLAGLLFVALGFPTPFPWFALGKEDVLGVTFGIASVAVLNRGTLRRHIVGAALLAALAILTKQTLIAASVAGAVALFLYDWRKAALFAALSGGLVLGVAAFFELTTHAFFANTVFGNAQPYRLDVLQTNLATLKAYQAAPLAVAGIGIARRLVTRRSFEDVLLPLYGLATVVPLVGLGTVGSAQNYWIELAAATAVLAATEIWTWLRAVDTPRRLAGGALAATILVNVFVAGRLALIWLPALGQYADPAEKLADFASIIEMVRDTDGDVVAEPMDALALAGKPALVEPWASDALYQSGTWDIEPLVNHVCTGRVRLAVLSRSLDEDVVAYHDYGVWPAPLLSAMRDTMTLRERRAGRYLYTVRPDAQCRSRPV